MRQTFEARPAMHLHHVHEMAALSGLLDLTDDELDAYVDLEVSTNPALVRDRTSTAAGQQPPGIADVVARLEPEVDEREELRRDARLAVARPDRPLVDLVVDSLDDRGRLTATVPELATTAGAAAARVAGALAAVRRTGPPGVAARDLRECLLLQLAGHEFEAGDPPAWVVRAVVERHLQDVADGGSTAAAAALGCDVETVAAAVQLIRTRLRPFVVLDGAAWPPGPRGGRASVHPDVLFRPAPDGTVLVSLRTAGRPPVAVARARARLAGEDVDRARNLVNRLARRRATVLAVAVAVAQRQRAFLLKAGPLAPMRQADVADAAGVDRSTVSRVVGARWASLPSGGTMRLRDFFDAPPAALTAVRIILARAAGPMSDSLVSRLLEAQGLPTARRTVAKYRSLLGVPPAGFRARRVGDAPRR